MFSELKPFPPIFQSGTSTPGAPGQGCPCHQQHTVEQGHSFWSVALDHLSHANPGLSLLSTSPGITRSWTLTPEPWADLQDPTQGAQLPLCPGHCPSALPTTSTFAFQTSLQLQSDSLKGCMNNFEDSCDLRAVSEQREKESKSKELL